MKRPAAAASLLAVLLLIGFQGSSAVFANPSQPLTLSVTGTILNAGSQVYTALGGQIVSAVVNGQTITPSSATFTYSLSASVSGFSATGSASFTLTGTTTGSVPVSVTGTVVIGATAGATMIPIGCTTTCNSEIPAFFVGSSQVTTTIGGSPTQTTPTMELESAYLDHWGGPIIVAAVNHSIVIVTTYSVGTIQWNSVVLGGTMTGTLGSQVVTGDFNSTSTETEDLFAGDATDQGVIAFTNMNPPSLDVVGSYVGTSIVPTTGKINCSSKTGIAGTCEESGFDSTGQYSLGATNSAGLVSAVGSYTTTWGVPAINFASTLSNAISVACQGATASASPQEPATAVFNDSAISSSGLLTSNNSTVTLQFYVWHHDAPPASVLAHGCGGVNTQSFAQLNVTSAAYSVDGSAFQATNVTFYAHDMALCTSLDGTQSVLKNWNNCDGSFVFIKVWTGSITVSVDPSPTTAPHLVVLRTVAQNKVLGGGGIAIRHTLLNYWGQPFEIRAGNYTGQAIRVGYSGEQPVDTNGRTTMEPVSGVYNTIVPPSGVIYGDFVPNANVTVSIPAHAGPSAEVPASPAWDFALGDNTYSVQQLSLPPA